MLRKLAASPPLYSSRSTSTARCTSPKRPACSRLSKMYSCVCIKQTPDSSSVYIDPISGQVDAGRFVQILNPADACALEAAVRLKEQFGGTVLALTLGPADAAGALRAALAIGADQAVRLWNPRADSWGPFAVAAALAGYISQHTP